VLRVEVQELEDLLWVYFEGDVVQDFHVELTRISLPYGDLIRRNLERPLRVLGFPQSREYAGKPHQRSTRCRPIQLMSASCRATNPSP
jgi:hypothetical protein